MQGAYFTIGEWMPLRSSLFLGTIACAALCGAWAGESRAQQLPVLPVMTAVVELPEAPLPQLSVEAEYGDGQKPSSSQLQNSPAQSPAPDPQNAQTPSSQGSSSSQTSLPPAQSEQDARKQAEEQLKEQEHQRVLGVLPNFNISYRADAVSLTAGEKIRLAFHSATDPVAFATASLVAGWGEAADSDSGCPWGAKGFGERMGAKYLDAFDGTMIGNGILPALLHQDPRYFRLGHGRTRHRLLYAMATTVICRHDNSHKWEPNYSNIIGNIASGAISNFYYPGGDTGFSQTISNGMIVTAEGTVGGVFQEFWPDLSRKWFHKDPTHGLDAEARAADAVKKAKQPLPPSPK